MDSREPHRLHQLIMDIVRATGLLQVDQAIPGQPVSVSQAFALHELDTGSSLSQRDLAERLHLEKSTVSRLAAEMQHKGLLVRERDPGNRRLYRLRLTDEGRALHASLASAFHDQYGKWVSAMTRAERDALLTGLTALVRAMRHDLAHRQHPASSRKGAHRQPSAGPAGPTGRTAADQPPT